MCIFKHFWFFSLSFFLIMSRKDVKTLKNYFNQLDEVDSVEIGHKKPSDDNFKVKSYCIVSILGSNLTINSKLLTVTCPCCPGVMKDFCMTLPWVWGTYPASWCRYVADDVSVGNSIRRLLLLSPVVCHIPWEHK